MTRPILLLTMAFSLFALPPLRAQDQAPSLDSAVQEQTPSIDSVIEVARAGMQADRTTIIGAAMNFNENEGAAFWPIYRQYERERSTLDDGRVAVIKDYTKSYPNLTSAEAKAMAERMFEFDSRLAVLKKRYFKKFNKVLPALTVTKFFQLERRIDLMMDMQVESSLPPLTQAKYIAQPKER
ncbi:MAG TPA: hypothetical protein VMI10_17925 [Terriglobales bacterium]|nr:hypothetical protein [Terriglobales bacterium]